MKTLLGIGRLSWWRYERVSDRYGSVTLYNGDGAVDLALPPSDRGRLVARVLQTRKSAHIGDLFRGLAPTTPEVGATIPLCTIGTARLPDGDSGPDAILVQPDDGRSTDWLDPKALYQLHDQAVELWWYDEEEGDL